MERLLKSQKKSHCKQTHCESKNQGRIKAKQQHFLPDQLNSIKDYLLSPLIVETQWSILQFK